jgi:hypothetical protein
MPYRIKEGYLTKRGHLVKSWRRRFFVLDGAGLSYFAKVGDATRPKGMVALAGATIHTSGQLLAGVAPALLPRCFALAEAGALASRPSGTASTSAPADGAATPGSASGLVSAAAGRGGDGPRIDFDKVYVIEASDEGERLAWLDCLAVNIALASAGSEAPAAAALDVRRAFAQVPPEGLPSLEAGGGRASGPGVAAISGEDRGRSSSAASAATGATTPALAAASVPIAASSLQPLASGGSGSATGTLQQVSLGSAAEQSMEGGGTTTTSAASTVRPLDSADGAGAGGSAETSAAAAALPQNPRGPVLPTLPASLKLFTGTWNMAEQPPPPMAALRQWLPPGCDVYAIGLQECMHADGFLSLVRSALGPGYLEMHHRIGATLKQLGFHGHIVLAVYVRDWMVASGVCKLSRAVRGAVALGRNLVVTRAANKGAVAVALPIRLPDADGGLNISSALVFVSCHLTSDNKGATRLQARNANAREMLQALNLELPRATVDKARALWRSGRIQQFTHAAGGGAIGGGGAEERTADSRLRSRSAGPVSGGAGSAAGSRDATPAGSDSEAASAAAARRATRASLAAIPISAAAGGQLARGRPPPRPATAGSSPTAQPRAGPAGANAVAPGDDATEDAQAAAAVAEDLFAGLDEAAEDEEGASNDDAEVAPARADADDTASTAVPAKVSAAESSDDNEATAALLQKPAAPPMLPAKGAPPPPPPVGVQRPLPPAPPPKAGAPLPDAPARGVAPPPPPMSSPGTSGPKRKYSTLWGAVFGQDGPARVRLMHPPLAAATAAQPALQAAARLPARSRLRAEVGRKRVWTASRWARSGGTRASRVTPCFTTPAVHPAAWACPR